MAWRIPHRCFETTVTTGVGGAGNPYLLQGSADVELWRPFSNAMSDGDQAEFVIMQKGAGGSALKMERFTGTYLSGSNAIRPDQLHESTSGGWSPSPITWGSGVRDIFPTLAMEPLNNLIDPEKGGSASEQGLIVRASASNFLARELKLGAIAAAALTLANPKGISGDPTLELVRNLLSRDAAASDAERQMEGVLRLNATETRIPSVFAVGPHTIVGTSSADRILKFTRSGTSNYLIEGGIGGALVRMLSVLDLVKFDFKESASSDPAVVDNEIATITTGATGTWRVIALGNVHYRFTEIPTGAFGDTEVTAAIGERVGGSGSLTAVRSRQRRRWDEHAGAGDWTDNGGIFLHRVINSATANTQYEFNLLLSKTNASGGGTTAFTCGTNEFHSIAVVAYRTA